MKENMKILFVCTGNICRSPTAEGVARVLSRQHGLEIEFDSAGIEGCHAGEAPDSRAQKSAARRGYELSELRARKIEATDFLRFDLILAMDRGHLARLKRSCPPARRDRIKLFLDYLPGSEGEEIYDPYYGGEAGFERVLDLCEDASEALLRALSPR